MISDELYHYLAMQYTWTCNGSGWLRALLDRAHEAGREDAAPQALDHDARLNGVRSRALVEYANRHHVVDERGWCSCNMYAPGDDDQCPERARLFAEALMLARGKPV